MIDRVTKHAQEVVSGLINRNVGESEIKCCQRHLRDMERQGTDKFPYVFKVERANHIIDLAETLTLIEGFERRPFKLWGFQDFIFGSLNGWVHKDTGYRRFKTSYVQKARQNGKSIENAVLCLYYGNFYGYKYPQIYNTATKELQARIVQKECEKFIIADKELSGTKTKKGLFTIKSYKSEIECNLTNGVIKALGRDTQTIDGFRPFFGSVDEYHKHKDNQMYKLLVDGAVNLPESLVSVITTAGFDLNGPCKELYDYCKKILDGIVEDETQFIYIAELNKDDDIWNEENWQKANPLWTPQKLENIGAAAIKAKEMGGEELRNFMTKNLNMWVQAYDNLYLNLENWKACESDMSLEDMRGRECYLGLDLSSGGDLTTGVLEFPFEIDGQRKYFLYSHSFIPAKRLAEHIKTDYAPYDIWARDGLITLTETLGGYKTDYKYIIAHFKGLIEKYDLKLKMIGYDPHNADVFLSDLESFGVDCVMITQSAKSLNDATIDFKLEVDAGNILYNKGEKLLSYSFANAVTVFNSFGEIKIDKEKRNQRVDPCDAAICAHKLAILNHSSYDPNEFATSDFLEKLWG